MIYCALWVYTWTLETAYFNPISCEKKCNICTLHYITFWIYMICTLYTIFDNSNNRWAKTSKDSMPDIVTYMYMYLHKWLSINGYSSEAIKYFWCCCLQQSSHSHVEVISLISLASPAISVRLSGSVLSVACHCRSVILSGLTVSVHLWPMPVVSGISCMVCSKGVTCFTSETCLTDNLPWLSQTSTLAFPSLLVTR